MNAMSQTVFVRSHLRGRPQFKFPVPQPVPEPTPAPRCAADDWEWTSVECLKDDHPNHVIVSHFMRIGDPGKETDLYFARRTPDGPLVLARASVKKNVRRT